ncbi:MAG: PorV/PorQ family protein [Bacteroidota bacterium]
MQRTQPYLIICFLLAASMAGAQESNKAGTSAAQFLKIGVGARAMGMGGATVGIVDDASAAYWNPAGLSGVQSFTLIGAHTRWFADVTHQYFGVVLPLGDDHRIGASATVLSAGDIEITTENQPRGTGTFYSATDLAIGLSYSGRLVEFFSFGATFKYITQSIYNESASAVAVDLGTILHTGFNGITIGMAFTNFGTSLKLEGRDLHRTYDPNPNSAANTGVSSYLGTESWELPVNFRVGIGWTVMGPVDAMLRDETHAVRLGADANHANDGPESAVVGLEYSWRNILALRGGYTFNDDVRTWSAGVGLHWGNAQSLAVGVDYAYTDLDRLGPIHVFTLILGL